MKNTATIKSKISGKHVDDGEENGETTISNNHDTIVIEKNII